MKQFLSVIFALAFALSGAIGHTSMVMDGTGMKDGVSGHSVHSVAADHLADDAPNPAHHAKVGACAAACAAACGFIPPLFQLKEREFVLDQPVACVRPLLVSALTGFDPPPPKA